MKHNTVIIKHPKMGKLLEQTFQDQSQFKLFLCGIHGPLELKLPVKYFNGDDFLLNIPYKILSESIVFTKYVGEKKQNSLSQHFKSRMEAEVIKES